MTAMSCSTACQADTESSLTHFTEAEITVRVTIEVRGRAFLFHFAHAKITAEREAEFEQAPADPHGTLSAHIERGPGAESFTSDVVARKFGFGHGS